MEREMLDFILERYSEKYEAEDFDLNMKKYQELESFKINENVYKQDPNFSNKVHYIMRLHAQYYMTKVFESMKVDLEDPNTAEVREEGNIGTAGRIVKMWCGANTKDDNELLCGRWAKPPRLASFPNTTKGKNNIPITKKVDLIAVCSHHAAPFSSTFRPDGKAIVSYIPDKIVLGISKLQRIVNHISKRGWLQEDLTKAIYNAVSEAAGCEDVYVGLLNIEHSCESIRGANSKDGSFSSEYYGGKFTKDKIRNGLKL